MKEIPLTASPRAETGKGAARRARMAGYIPAVVYGPETEPMSISVGAKDLRIAMKQASASTIFALQVNGKQNKVIVREMQRDPVTSHVLHLDFHAISMAKPIHISIPIKLEGVPRGVRSEGGIMQTTMRELEVYGLPGNIPDEVTVDVADLGIGDSIHVSDIQLPDIEILSELKRTVVVISAPTVIKAAADEAEEEAVLEGAEAEAAEEGEEAPSEEGEKKKKEEK